MHVLKPEQEGQYPTFGSSSFGSGGFGNSSFAIHSSPLVSDVRLQGELRRECMLLGGGRNEGTWLCHVRSALELLYLSEAIYIAS